MAEPREPTVAELQAQLAALRAEMHDFTYTVSHDLRAPLRHIVSFAQLIQDEGSAQLSPELQGFLGTLNQSAKHLGAMLDALLELSRAGTVPLHIAPVPLQALVQEVVNELNAQHPQRHIEWLIDTALPVVQADASLLRQVLWQVMGNAVKFTGTQAQATIVVDVQPGGESGQVMLRIQDNGVGFNPALVTKLFQPFQRLHNAKSFDGQGMGLALVRKLLQRMGGSVHADAQEGAGCTVRVLLPRA
jgi:signal transduction histidine kinase